jgi:transposase
MYEAMDFLHGQAEEVERAVFLRTAHLFNLEVDLIFYDTTTAALALDAKDEEGQGLRCFGRPKNGAWAPQVVVALAVTREGLPVRSWVFPGNTTHVKTKGLLVIERGFRTLKSTQIKLEPMHHWLPHRIEAHIKICVFALLLERVAEMTCQKPWSAIKNLLSTLQASEFQTSNQTFCQRNEIPPELLKILKSLEISPPKLVLEVSSAPSKP